jgi:hypothetical protein
MMNLHPEVDYTVLSERELKIKASRELFTIFYLTKNQGLTDVEIHQWTQYLNYTGYNGFTPDRIVSGAVYRWNDIVTRDLNLESKCINVGDGVCKRPPNYGYEVGNPICCKFHGILQKPPMNLVLELRLYKPKKSKNLKKGRFYLYPSFAKRVFPYNPEYWNPTSSDFNLENVRIPINLLQIKRESSVIILPEKKDHENEKEYLFEDFDSLFNFDYSNVVNDFILNT